MVCTCYNRLRLHQRLWHALTGADYATFKFGYDQYVRRAYRCNEGHWYSKMCGTIISTKDCDAPNDYHKYVVITQEES